MAFVLAAVIAFCASPISTEAAAKKVTAVKDYKKAPEIQKGSYKVTFGTAESYVRFTASKDGTYTFAVSDIKTTNAKKDDTGLGNLTADFLINQGKRKAMYPQQLTLENNKKNYALYVIAKEKYKNNLKTITPNSFLPSREGKLQLKKGQTVYLKFSYASDAGNYHITIKK